MTGGSLIGALAGTAGALLFVLGLAWVVLRLLKRWQDRAGGVGAVADGGLIRHLRAMPVGPRERVVLMEAEGERLLIGVAAGSVTLLARWPRTAPDAGIQG